MDLELGKLIKILGSHERSTEKICLTPDGCLALSQSWEGIKVWNTVTREILFTPTIGDGLNITLDGQKALTFQRPDKTIEVWNLNV